MSTNNKNNPRSKNSKTKTKIIEIDQIPTAYKIDALRTKP